MRFKDLITIEIIKIIAVLLIVIAFYYFAGVKNKATLFFIIFVVFIMIFSGIKRIVYIISFINNPNNHITEIEEEISKKSIKYKDCYATNDYLFMMDKLKKIYYSDIIVVDCNFTILSGSGKGKTLGYKCKLFLKDESSVSCNFYFTDNSYKEFTNFLKEKNSNIFFGSIKNYKNLETK